MDDWMYHTTVIETVTTMYLLSAKSIDSNTTPLGMEETAAHHQLIICASFSGNVLCYAVASVLFSLMLIQHAS